MDAVHHARLERVSTRRAQASSCARKRCARASALAWGIGGLIMEQAVHRNLPLGRAPAAGYTRSECRDHLYPGRVVRARTAPETVAPLLTSACVAESPPAP